MSCLKVFSAGVAMGLTKETVERWEKSNPKIPVELSFGGSVDGVRRLIAGEEFDLLILADDTNIETMMMPDYTDGYYIWAGNRMVITGTPGHVITSEDWEEKMLDPNATFFHMNPYGDPGGYRAVMCMLLADRYKSGLTDKLMNHPGHKGMEKPEPFEVGHHKPPEADYMFMYASGPISKGLPYAELPGVMNLGNPDLADIYASVAFAVDDENTVKGAPIAHALTIPFSAQSKSAAREFAALFLDTDFRSKGFVKYNKAVGNWRL